ncbi:MAG: hypothetical protein ACRD2W_11450 [Acidimicrobiales bacterium]
MESATRLRLPSRILLLVVLGAVVAAFVLLTRSPAETPLNVGAQQGQRSTATLPDLNISVVPTGFTLKGKETTPPQAGRNQTLTYTLASGDPRAGQWKGTIYVQAELSANGAADLNARRGATPQAADTTVRGKPAILGEDTGAGTGIRGLEWVEQPNLLIRVVARGPVTDADLRAVAEGVTLQ